MPTLLFGQIPKFRRGGGGNPCQMLFSYGDTGGRSNNERCKLPPERHAS